MRSDTAQHYRAFLLLGDAYFKAGQYDSATTYINKSLSATGYGTKTSAYMRLAEIAEAQGNLKSSLALTEKYTLYLDSLHLANKVTIFLSQKKR